MSKKTVNFKTKLNNYKQINYHEHLNKTQKENKKIIKSLEHQLYYIKIINQAITQAKHEARCQNSSCCSCSFSHTHEEKQSKHGEHNKNNK